MGWFKIKKTLITWEWNITFLWYKKILNLSLKWHVEVTFKKLKHIILGADYMKKNKPVNRAGLRTKQITACYYMKLLHLCRGDELFEINSEFKWKQPVTKMSSEIFFFQKFVSNIVQKHFLYIKSELLLYVYFKDSSYRFFGLLFVTYFENGYFDTSISN